jgi:hypothetical protein
MNHDEYISISSEVSQLESLLAEIPVEDAIDRMGLEARLKSAKEALTGLKPLQLVQKARLTFRGRPVFGSRGVGG